VQSAAPSFQCTSNDPGTGSEPCVAIRKNIDTATAVAAFQVAQKLQQEAVIGSAPTIEQFSHNPTFYCDVRLNIKSIIMSETCVPLISSGVAGPLGVVHLPRLWQKV